MVGVKEQLQQRLQDARARVLSRLQGLSEYDMRRPMTPTGTNLLGLVKHLAGVEYNYLGDSFGRPAPDTMSWIEDGSILDGADMWATPEESSEELIGLYQRACGACRPDDRRARSRCPRIGRPLAAGSTRHDPRHPVDPGGRRDSPARRPRRHRPGAHRWRGRPRPRIVRRRGRHPGGAGPDRRRHLPADVRGRSHPLS